MITFAYPSTCCLFNGVVSSHLTHTLLNYRKYSRYIDNRIPLILYFYIHQFKVRDGHKVYVLFCTSDVSLPALLGDFCEYRFCTCENRTGHFSGEAAWFIYYSNNKQVNSLYCTWYKDATFFQYISSFKPENNTFYIQYCLR